MNISSVGGSNSNLSIYHAGSRSSAQQVRRETETNQLAASPSDPKLAEKVGNFTRIQQAMISALRTGEAINSQGLLSPIT